MLYRYRYRGHKRDGCPARSGRRASSNERIYLTPYRRTRGKPLKCATDLLEQIIAAVGTDEIEGVHLTGSGAGAAAVKLGVSIVNEFKAIAVGLAAMGVEATSVFEMGGETSKYLRFSGKSNGKFDIIDYATNGDCAAGTGSFLDQQARRLKYAIDQVGALVLQADRAAQVAGRCSVFAKSDMIHAQQKGYSPPEVLGGLCNAVARNFRTAVVRSHPVVPPVAFIGGVTANAAVVRAMREAFELDDG
ncbi:MAG: BadF/BadG/BcrA/BcrD ATPase family protein, partial [Planctomycetota bacterium]